MAKEWKRPSKSAYSYCTRRLESPFTPCMIPGCVFSVLFSANTPHFCTGLVLFWQNLYKLEFQSYIGE